MEKLLESRSDVEGQTALHHAAKEGSISVAECLITEFNADKEAKDHKNRTPIFIAAEFSKFNLLEFHLIQIYVFRS